MQTGASRTGTFFAMERIVRRPGDPWPGLAGRFPLSAVVSLAEVMDAPAPGGLSGTYAGSPLACAAANAVLDVFEGTGCSAQRAVRPRLSITDRGRWPANAGHR